MSADARLSLALAILISIVVIPLLGAILRRGQAPVQRIVLQRPIIDGMLFGVGLIMTVPLLTIVLWSVGEVAARAAGGPSFSDVVQELLREMPGTPQIDAGQPVRGR